jgi:hypothetical protein
MPLLRQPYLPPPELMDQPLEQRRRRLRAETEILVSTARSLGTSDAEVLEALRAALGR